ncbi:coiled-coil domain-containing protein 96 [Sceloporus undulatus]|uniref:coiled-coil domain-containing protein 96 n=1 Tax=Sceloporus undulatus TaxID=8520 RepID=UPI001C4C0C26|nr:coiled-coil domain-containing protein 96 [Sceloporus undulatus]
MAEEEGLQAPAGLEPGEAETEAAPELQEEEGKEEMKEEGKEKAEEEKEEGPAKASAASLHSEAPEAESVSAFSSSEVEGEAQAEEAEEKPEESPPPAAAPGEPPDGEEAEEAKPQEEEAEKKEAAEAEAASTEAEEEEEEATEPRAASPAPPSSRGTPPLPTSSSFSAGELLEPPLLAVGEELGRRISISLRELEQRCLSGGSLRLGSSPESQGSEAAGFESEEQRMERLAQERRLREELTEECRRLQAERRRRLLLDAKIQGKLAELLGKGGGVGGKEAAPARAELEQHISDREQRFSRYLSLLEELRSQQAAEGSWYRQQLDALQGACRERLAKVEAQWKAHQALKKEVAVFTMGRRLGGRQAAVREVEQIQAREQGKEREMTEVRLEYIKLKHRIQKLEANLKAQEELAEGLHLIDFEQLKIENQTYNEKIEERNEELLKLRRRITNTVQIISPVKEKLQFVEAENQGQKAQLMAAEGLVAQKREILTKTKQARDKMRMDNERLQQKCGLLGHTLLLRDYENKVDAAEARKERLDMLKRRHAGLALTCKRMKISFHCQKMQELEGGG